MPWEGKVAIELPYHGNASYKVDINGDLKNVSSHLPSPVNKPAGEPMPIKINVAGGLSSFDLTGSVGAKNHINSRWLLNGWRSFKTGRRMKSAAPYSFPSALCCVRRRWRLPVNSGTTSV